MPELEFKGKQHVYAHHLSIPYRPLVLDAARSLDPLGVDGNLIIHGDNLLALKALLPRYAGRVKCVYIDPPYNTGNEGWIYSDSVNSPLMREWLKANSPVDGEDLERHDKWLCMMWPRLHLLRDLLADDGAIFISIDDNEQHHLRMLMDEIFGPENFVETFVWKKKGGASNTETLVGDIVENVHMYAKDISILAIRKRIIESVNYPYSDDEGSYRLQSLTKTDEGAYRRDTMKFGIPVPGTDEVAYPPPGQRWTAGHGTMMDMLKAELLDFELSDEVWRVRWKDYFDENSPQTGVYLNLLLDCGSLRTAKNELTALGFRREDFETPKPTPLVKRLLSVVAGPNDIVLDSFAGSGTTAHAALALNKEDGGARRFILVECEEYADAITAERVRRVIRGVPGARDAALREGLGGEFAYCELGEPIGVEGMLTGESLPPYESLAAYLLHAAAGISAGGEALAPRGGDGLFYSADGTDYYLRYEPDVAWLRNERESALNKEQAERIGKAVGERGARAVVFAAARFVGLRELRERRITFCQLPYELHRAG